MDETRDLVEFLWKLQARDLPAEVFDRTRYLLLDYLGVAIRGSRAESSAPVYKMIERLNAAGCSTVIGTKIRTLPGFAALANGTAAHAIELDDTHNAGSIHLGVVMFSTVLALAESLAEVPVEQLTVAVVAGYEAAARVAMAAGPKEQYLRGFHPTSTCGVFGAAAAASKLLSLEPDQMLSAFGIAGSMAAGSLEFLADGAWTKRLHPGLAAQNGIQAAMLAAGGFRGPSTILEGDHGFLKAYSKDAMPKWITRDPGKPFQMMRTAVKPHACCRYMQGPIDAILALVREHDIRPERVERVELGVLEAGWPLVVEPHTQKMNPQSIVDAQFSMPFGAAVALVRGAAGIDQFTGENLRAPEIRRLMTKVVIHTDGQLEKKFPSEWPARAAIELDDGRRFEKLVEYPKGDWQNPLSWEELIVKFRSLAECVVGPERCERVVELVRAGDWGLWAGDSWL